ncbi:MAG: hypothetical protein LBS12_00290 [Prevotellaceae bacterium]|jgi:uncharacterized protein YfaS (alpha-2-macroglobulin family)|nr:hypothetical protein [Prevotellaceae bacterium]
MKKKFALAAIIAAFLPFSACDSGSGAAVNEPNPYIAACTGGYLVSINDIIIVQLETAPETNDFDNNALRKIFKSSPAIDGETYWLDENTIGLKPSTPLKPGTEYRVRFDVAKLFPEAQGNYKIFNFAFSTIKPSFSYNIIGLQIYDDNRPDNYFLQGFVTTADYTDPNTVEKLLLATIDGKQTDLRWEHDDTDADRHTFTIDDLAAREAPYSVILNWNGKPIDYHFRAADTVAVPPTGAFMLLDVKINPDNNSIECLFSKPLDPRQKFASFIQVGDFSQLRFITASNRLEIHLPNKPVTPVTLAIREGLHARSGERLQADSQKELIFEELKPLVRAIGKGVIMPNSSGLTFPFQAVSLRAIDVLVYRTYEKNILQFLQINNIDGRNELRRVAKPIARKIIRLDENKNLDLRQWNTFSIDLASVIAPEPGAIYTVKIAYNQQYSIYGACPGDDLAEADLKTLVPDEVYDTDSPDHYYSYYDYDDYDDDNTYYGSSNPCHSSYYNNSRFILRNILASDIGLIAKRGNENQYLVFVTNLITALPMSGVQVEIYNYQQQKIGNALSDGNGLASVNFTGTPYIITAHRQNQKSYLRIDNNLALSLSTFDVAGAELSHGLKGYIYGERGVWRPGDTIFLTFVLQDRLNTVPRAHPLTFELYNVNDQLVAKQMKTESQNGFYSFACPTNPSDPAGNWNAYVKIGGAVFSKTVRIATVKPNRLKIETKLHADPVLPDQPIAGKITAQWLHGAKTAGNEADISVRISPIRTTFDGYGEYHFDDITKNFYGSNDRQQRGNLDANGIMSFSIPVEHRAQAPGKLRASIAVRVFEAGGEFSFDNFTAEISPYKTYVGLKMPKGSGYYNRLKTNTPHTFQVISLDHAGKPVSRDLKVEIFKNEWNWWWFSPDGNLADYTYRLYNNRISEIPLKTAQNGTASFTYNIEYPDWGLYLIRITDPESGHAATQKAYIDWWSYGRGTDRENAAPAILAFQTDKEKYAVGEKAIITIPSNAGAKAIVSIENGDRLINAFRIDCRDGETPVTIATTPEMTPNAYISVSLIQPHRQTQNDLPMRLFGVIPLIVEDPATRIQPVIKAPDIIRPQQPFSVQVHENTGKEMTYTIAIIDEGLLDLTHFKTPDLWQHFFQREALGVRTWDLYNFVIGAYGGRIEQLFAIGGDEELNAAADNKKANRFKPVVRFAGPFTIAPGKKANHPFMIDNYVGSVRIMVIAGNRTAYGKADKTVPVRSPLMIQASLPRVVGPAEELIIPASVFAMEPQIRNVKIEFLPDDFFAPLDGRDRALTFAGVGDQLVRFRVRTKNKIGAARIKVIATAGSESAENEIEIDVRPANPPTVATVAKILNGNASTSLTLSPPGIPGTNIAQIEVSAIPPLNLGARLNYLLQYPHGCLEQTTSAVFPQLFLPAVIDISDVEKNRAADNIKAAIRRLASFVRQDGSFSYWPGGTGYTCMWTNSYAGHFILEAERKGYAVPAAMKENWIAFQQKNARNWTPDTDNSRYPNAQNDLIQAYRLYTLALAKKEELSAMNRLKERQNLSTHARWMLAGAYALAGQRETAVKIIDQLPLEASAASDIPSDTYGSSSRDNAIVLDVLTLIGNKDNAFRMAKQISDAINSSDWLSTQTTAFCLLALSKFALNEKGELHFSVAFANDKPQTIKSSKPVYAISIPPAAQPAQPAPMSMVSPSSLRALQATSPLTLAFENKAANTLFVRFSIRGIPPAGEEKPAEHDLAVAVRYLKPDGSELDVARIPQGTDFFADIRVRNPGRRGAYTNLALTQIVPSGWEITENRLADDNLPDGITYRDIRDDRILTYFDLPEGRTVSLRVALRAAYVGKFYLPAIACEAMYDASISANTAGRHTEVN